jgi:hypothetical protein
MTPRSRKGDTVKDLGDRASGVVANENDWGGKNPEIIRPRRVASGVVVGLYPGAPDVVKIRTSGGETLVIRLRR